MNYFLIFTIILTLVMMLAGYKRGFIRAIFSLISIYIIIIISSIAMPYISNIIIDKTQIYDKIYDNCNEYLSKQVSDQQINIKDDLEEKLLDNQEWIPQQFKDIILKDSDAALSDNIDMSTYVSSISEKISMMIINAISFTAAMIISGIIVRIIIAILDIISRLPVIEGMNKAAGIVVGIAESVLILWVIFIVVMICYKTTIGTICMEQIGDNSVLTFLYKNNLILKIILNHGLRFW